MSTPEQRPITAAHLISGQMPPSDSRLLNSIRQSPAMALVPFVLPQVLFTGGLTQQKMGPGLAVQIGFTSANTDYTVVHNLGHPIQMVWAVSAPVGVFIPKLKISSTANSNTTKQVILQSDTVANPTTAVMF